MAPLLAVSQSIILALCAGIRIASAIVRASDADDGAEIMTTSRICTAAAAAAAATGEGAPKIQESPYEYEYDASTHDAAATDRLGSLCDGDGSGSKSIQLIELVENIVPSGGQINDNDGLSRGDFNAWDGGGGGDDLSDFADHAISGSLVTIIDDDKVLPLTSKISPSVLDHAAGAAVITKDNGRGADTNSGGGVSGHNLDTGNNAQASNTDYIPLEDLVADNHDDIEAAMIAVETSAETEEMCGEGEHRKACSNGEGCCNSSCGICAPKGQPWPQIACGELGRAGGGASKEAAQRDSRALRHEALANSFLEHPSTPPKDRLRSLQLHMPELFRHVSPKGFKRLIYQVTGRPEISDAILRRRPSRDVFAGDKAVAPGTLESPVLAHAPTSPPQTSGLGAPPTPLPSVDPKSFSGDSSDVRLLERLKARAGALARKRHGHDIREGVNISPSLRGGEGGRGGGAEGGGGGGGGKTAANHPSRSKENLAAARAAECRQHSQNTKNPLSSLVSPAHPRSFMRNADENDRPTAVTPKYTGKGDLTSDVERPVTGLGDVDVATTMEGLLDREISEAMKEESDRLGRARASVIEGAMSLLWEGYCTHAWGFDEVKPLGRKGNDNWGGMGVTLVDSLDTLWLMGLKAEFYQGRDWVRDHLTFDKAGTVSVFETTIRVLGGLLSAFELSRDQVFLARAKELADRLMPAFGSSTGLPYKMVHLSSGKTGGGSTSVLSELGTLQLEFRYLSQAIGDDTYANTVNRVYEVLAGMEVPHGLYPVMINPNTGQFSSTQVTFGALGDSFYEYLLKVWMQGGRKETYRRMYDDAMDGVADVLVQKGRGLTYLSEWNGKSNHHRMDHLACFMAGNLALGAMTSSDTARAARDLRTGKALAYTCYQMYLRTPTGLSPETIEFNGIGDMRVRDKARFYTLRPETLESFFILHQLTGDPVYREWGWDIFQAIERHCRVGVGYGSYPDVENPNGEADDHMESFFPGETLKYLYLLMQPDQQIDLMEYTFNTEAHPLRVFHPPHSVPEQILR